MVAIKKVAVLGAGTMGAQIAALMANAGLSVWLFDLPGHEEQTGPAQAGLTKALQSRPPAFYAPENAAKIQLGSFADLSVLAQVDWVIEAIVEDSVLKDQLLTQVESAIGSSTLVSTNTSGLSITALAKARSVEFQKRFMGIHFFNPPRYMELVELIPGPLTEAHRLEEMCLWLGQTLGKGVVRCKDTPNFIANRLGGFAIMDLLHRWGESDLSVEAMDRLTGTLIGRPQTATLRLCDMIGLDILSDVAETAYNGLVSDPWRAIFVRPNYVEEMLKAGLLGTKTQAGFYRKTASGLEVLKLSSLSYRALTQPDLSELNLALKARTLKTRLEAVFSTEGPLSSFVQRHLLEVLAYAATHAETLADDIYQIDRAMCWGFNWEAGPFQLWDMLGHERIKTSLGLAGIAVPPICEALAAAGKEHFYYRNALESVQVYTPRTGQFEVLQEPCPTTALLSVEKAESANSGAFLVDLDEGFGALVLQGKLNVIGPPGLELIQKVAAEAPYKGLILCGSGGNLSAGADLKQLSQWVAADDWTALEAFVKAFQDAVLALRYAPFPVVAVPWGLALGGGCEFSMGVDGRVAEAELKMGLVETQVGVIPGGGGCKEIARRNGDDIDAAFEVLFKGYFSANAYQARTWGLLNPDDPIHMGYEQALRAGVDLVQRLAESYDAPAKERIATAGSAAITRLTARLDEALAKNNITVHDHHVGTELARVLCGGEGKQKLMDEQDLLDMERETFLRLCGETATQARLAHMLETGKPLKN